MRVLAIAGLTTPAMQIMRSISEDVDMALVVLLRPKVARQFAECRTPEAAGEFWKRHVAGGRAFRAVAEQLYRVGLDYSEDSSYARWRRRSRCCWVPPCIPPTSAPAGRRGVNDCLYFATLRLQELCVYSLMLGQALRTDLAAALPLRLSRPRQGLLRVALEGGEIVLDQMRWLTAAEEPAPPVS